MPGLRSDPSGAPYGPLVRFQTEDVLPPSAVYVGPSDVIVLRVVISNVGQAILLTLTVRLLTPQGEIKESVLSVQPTPVPNGFTDFTLPPAEGYLLSAHVTSTATSRGISFARCFLAKNTDLTGSPLGAILFQGYVTQQDDLGYPGSGIAYSQEGRGFTHTVFVGNPAAGQPAIFTVPSGVNWIVKAALYNIITDGNAGNRTPILQVFDQLSNLLVELSDSLNIGASTSVTFTWAVGCQLGGAAAIRCGPFPQDFVLLQGYQIKLNANFAGAGDHITAPFMILEEWASRL